VFLVVHHGATVISVDSKPVQKGTKIDFSHAMFLYRQVSSSALLSMGDIVYHTPWKVVVEEIVRKYVFLWSYMG
jgi:hypothetical protein